MLVSRLSRRLRDLGLRDFGSYRKLLASGGDAKEHGPFISAITTNVTSFFSVNPGHFDVLAGMGPRFRGAGSGWGQDSHLVGRVFLGGGTIQHRNDPQGKLGHSGPGRPENTGHRHRPWNGRNGAAGHIYCAAGRRGSQHPAAPERETTIGWWRFRHRTRRSGNKSAVRGIESAGTMALQMACST